MFSAEPVTRSTLGRVFPIVAPRPLSAVPDRIWMDEEWERICIGYRARDMDEKWDIFAEGDRLFMHRSWTGYGIYEVSFVGAEGGVRISAGVVESDRDRYRSRSDEFDGVMLELLIRSVLLGEAATELREKLWGRSR
ncbi:hypothetical protein [Actinoallomurus sp. CA-150999]|uniref:hypothetical protein n=1 Tax=Actinoallomurus sp. CA-150999 TaxID=3239887 RepID=UPI003D8B92A2